MTGHSGLRQPRCDINDATASLHDHLADDRLAHQERTIEIHRTDSAPIGEATFRNPVKMIYAG